MPDQLVVCSYSKYRWRYLEGNKDLATESCQTPVSRDNTIRKPGSRGKKKKVKKKVTLGHNSFLERAPDAFSILG